MSYTVEKISNPNAILVVWNEDYSISKEWTLSVEEIVSLLDEVDEPLRIINDATAFQISVNDLLEGTGSLLKSGNLLNHPMLKGFITVTSSAMLKRSVDGLRKLGLSQDHQVVDSVEEALDLISSSKI